MTNINEMFAVKAKEAGGTTTNIRSLAGTAELTQVAADLTNVMLKTMSENVEQYGEKMKASMTSHEAMDKLIKEIDPYKDTNVDFLRAYDEVVLESMLKSQQSKRSRSKGKTMTQDNYRALMSGAISEHLLRFVMGKEKQSAGRSSTGVGYTEAEYEELAADQNKLRKVLRNVQSKKSIMRAKEGFSEEDPRWIELLEAEVRLKSLRQDVIRIDSTRKYVHELLKDVDIFSAKLPELKELLNHIAQYVAPPVEASEEVIEEDGEQA